MPDTLPYGSWPSPITSETLVEQVVRLGDVAVLGDQLWWNEGRPAEAGRQVLVSSVAAAGGGQRSSDDRIPEGFSARTAVHEYGGNSYALFNPVPATGGSDTWGSTTGDSDAGGGGEGATPPPGEGAVPPVCAVFSNWADQRLWLVAPGVEPVAVTPEPVVARGDRYADLAVVPGSRWVLAIRERHRGSAGEAAVVDNDVVAVSLPPSSAGRQEGEIKIVAAGHDFYAAPRPSPDGRRVAWISWDHPAMPWDSTELWVADLSDDAAVGPTRKVAGGLGESVVEPVWSSEGVLHYISDRSGWWNIYDEDGRALAPLDAEFSGPLWQLGQSSYIFLDDGRLIATWATPGGEKVGLIEGGVVHPLDVAFSAFGSLRAMGDAVVAVAGSPTADPAVVRITVPDSAGPKSTVEVVRRSRESSLDPFWLSVPQPIEYPTEGGLHAHALWYPPQNPDTRAPEGDTPPLMVISHGGPTASATPVLSYGVQYWTSRGFGVVDVDYGGSTGYGRAYRQRLRGRWGITDIDDCVAAAQWLAERGLVDAARMVIRGGSAGGYTTLAALTFRDVFAAGASHFGVADLELLARDTHKFESRYLDGLVGPYPDAIEVYHQRSPIYHVEGLDRPLILFQGTEDMVVPPEQAEVIAAALGTRGIPVAHLTFAGEQHGFRQAATIRRVIDTELDFYGRVLGFTPVDTAEPYTIVNEEALPAR